MASNADMTVDAINAATNLRAFLDSSSIEICDSERFGGLLDAVCNYLNEPRFVPSIYDVLKDVVQSTNTSRSSPVYRQFYDLSGKSQKVFYSLHLWQAVRSIVYPAPCSKSSREESFSVMIDKGLKLCELIQSGIAWCNGVLDGESSVLQCLVDIADDYFKNSERTDIELRHRYMIMISTMLNCHIVNQFSDGDLPRVVLDLRDPLVVWVDVRSAIARSISGESFPFSGKDSKPGPLLYLTGIKQMKHVQANSITECFEKSFSDVKFENYIFDVMSSYSKYSAIAVKLKNAINSGIGISEVNDILNEFLNDQLNVLSSETLALSILRSNLFHVLFDLSKSSEKQVSHKAKLILAGSCYNLLKYYCGSIFPSTVRLFLANSYSFPSEVFPIWS